MADSEKVADTGDNCRRLLIVANQPSPNTRSLAQAVLRGARNDAIDNVQTTLLDPLSASAEDVLHCHGVIIGTTENFASMSGLVKDFFERIYYPCLEKTQGLPYALYVRAGNDGSGTRQGVERIVTGLRWSAVAPCLLLQGDYRDDFDSQCEELGMLMAAGLESGIF